MPTKGDNSHNADKTKRNIHCSIKGDKEYMYHGDRSKEELLQFVIRMSGPPVQQVTLVESVDVLKENHAVFFMYVGPQENQVWDSYYSVAGAYQANAAFYATNPEIAKMHFEVGLLPAIVAYKEKYPKFFQCKSNLELQNYCLTCIKYFCFSACPLR